jgi:hypothetical protein
MVSGTDENTGCNGKRQQQRQKNVFLIVFHFGLLGMEVYSCWKSSNVNAKFHQESHTFI